jgi:sugar (pentulose or hexulose) kinase
MSAQDSTKDLILAIDCGTQNVKAAVFDSSGKVLSLSNYALKPNSSPETRFVEHDTEDYWEKTREAIRNALKRLGAAKAKRLRAVGLTAQRGTVIPVDDKGKPTRPAIHFSDTRKVEGLGKLGGFWGLLFKIIGLYSAISYVREHSWYTWIRRNEPEIYEKTSVFMQVASFLTYRLTGEIAESTGNMVGMFPFDHGKMKFYPQKGIQEIFGVSPKKLPPLKTPSSIMGSITKSASKKTGIPEGLPVIVGGGDVQSAMVGMGVIEENSAGMVLGSVNALCVPSKKHLKEKQMRFIAWAAGVSGYYVLETGLKAGFTTVSWFRDELAREESEIARKSRKSPEEVLDEKIREIPPGSLGLFVQPYWNPPFHRDDWARGLIMGFTLAHTKEHIYRAMLEGMAFETREGLEAIEEISGAQVAEMPVSGGGSKSDTALDIMANVMGIPIVRMQVDEASALGAAICAAYGSGLVTSLQEGIEKMSHRAERFEPDPTKKEVYDKVYRTYKEIYSRVTDLYRDTADLALYD